MSPNSPKIFKVEANFTFSPFNQVQNSFSVAIANIFSKSKKKSTEKTVMKIVDESREAEGNVET